MQRRPLSDQLRTVGRTFGDADWIIVADEYPPDIIGGAEVSLHETLISATEFLSKGFVVKFSGGVDYVQFYRHEEVNVIMCPQQPTPLHAFSPSDRFDRLLGRFAPSIFAEGVRIVGLFLRFGSWVRRFRVVCMGLTLRRPSGGILTDGLPEAHHLHATCLSLLVKEVKPKVVMANNTRSIMAVARAVELNPGVWSGVRRIASVRDNRFFCARHNQIVRVGGRDCVRCDLACAAEDAPRARRLQAALLNDTAQVRQKSLGAFDEVTVTSRFLLSQLLQLTPTGSKITIVPNFARHEIASKAQAVSYAERDIVIVIGSINEAKGQFEFVQSAPEILRANPSLDIWLAGRGDRMKAQIVRFSAENGIEERVRFLGFLDRPALYRAIRQSKVVALPTLWPEPFGRVPLEAALCERPVVSFATGGLTELIEHEKTGLLVAKGDFTALWEEILRLLENPALRHRLATRAQSLLGKRYSEAQSRQAFHTVLGFGDTTALDEKLTRPL